MRQIVFIIICLVNGLKGSAQDMNERLFDAVSRHDSLAVFSCLNNGANANFKRKVEFMELSMLISAVLHKDVATVKALVEHQAVIDWRDPFQSTAPMYAAASGDKEITSYLIGKGADVTADDK